MAMLTGGELQAAVQSGNISPLYDGLRPEGLSPRDQVEGGKSFVQLLGESLDKVNQDQVEADTAMKELIAGRSKNIHETMLTVERADTSLRLMMQVRNKMIDAYREMMRIQS